MTFCPYWVFFEGVAEKENPVGGIKMLIIFVLPQTKIIMQQVYHSNATTNLNIRSQIQNNAASNLDLAVQFGISEQTVSKWKNRNSLKDASCTPLNIKYALSDLEKALVISLRKSSWMPIDEVWETLLVENPKVSQGSQIFQPPRY